jgi:hypothetical protein
MMATLKKTISIAAIGLFVCLSFSNFANAYGVCNFVSSDSACQNAPVGSPCAKGDFEGVCTPASKFGDSISCKCVYGKPAKAKKCKGDLRWSPVKQQCIKVMGASPDGKTQCIPPYYWDEDNKNCEILF